MPDQYLSTDPNAGLPKADGYLSTDPNAGVSGGGAMNFAVVNGQRVPVDDDTGVGAFVSHAATQINPVPIGQMIPFPQAAGGAGLDAPIKAVKNILAAQGVPLDNARAAYAQGDYGGAAIHLLNYMIPLLGPVLDKSGNEVRGGKYAAGLGDAFGLAASLFGPKALSEAHGSIGPLLKTNPNLAEAAAVRFGQERGIPVDAATASGNGAVKGIQSMADRSLGGSFVAQNSARTQASALTRVGGELAEQAHDVPVTPEDAGTGVRGSIEGLIGDLHAQASTAYEKLRSMEADPANAGQVPGQSPEAVSASRAVQDQMQTSLGRVPSASDLHELRRVKVELDALPFKAGKLVSDNPGVTSDTHYDPRSAGAPVYHDILEASVNSTDATRGQMRQSIDRALSSGRFDNTAKAALDVARKRLNGDRGVSKPYLPPSAGDVAAPTQTMLMPVDIRPAKTALGPMYQQLKREAELVPLQGGKARALVALDRLLNGPDHAPVSVVDAALGDLKSMARGADLPALRTDAQGVAANAVKHLDAMVQHAVSRAGPEAVDALKEGRAATIAKYQTADVLDKLRTEPVQVYRQLTAPKDSGIQLLKQVREVAPSQMPVVARGYLEDLLSQATGEGGFDKTGRLQAEWSKLGSETKRLLFPQPGQTQMLDHFFLLAKKLNENVNPSGTGQAVMRLSEGAGAVSNPLLFVMSEAGAAGLSKLLHAPAGVRALTRTMSLSLNSARSPMIAKAGAFAELAKAARALGVQLTPPQPAVPAMATGTPQ